jgi:hypothetical protein
MNTANTAGGQAPTTHAVTLDLARHQVVVWLLDTIRGVVPLAMVLALSLAMWAPGVRDRGLNYGHFDA